MTKTIISLAVIAMALSIYSDLRKDDYRRQHAIPAQDCKALASAFNKDQNDRSFAASQDYSGDCTLTVTKKDFTPA